jgi:amicyanin
MKNTGWIDSGQAVLRRGLTRQVLAMIAGICVIAAILALLALPGSRSKAPALHLPGAAAANAAYEKGLSQASTFTAPAGVAVAIKNYAFAPASVSVAVGTTVTWTNDDTAPHTVTVSSGPVTFSSPTLQKGDTYSFTFTTPGTYSYYCAVHPSMVAKVIVTGSTTTSTPTATPTTTTTTAMPSSTPTTSMSMPMPSGGSSDCAVSSGLQTLLTHINSAHLSESPAQQVSDILNLDSYIGNHLVLVEHILSPLTDGGLTSALSNLMSTFLTHVNTAHLDESPAQQASDILNVNTYVGNHLALVQHMASGFEALAC